MSRERRPSFATPTLEEARSQSLEKGTAASSSPSPVAQPSTLFSSFTSYFSAYIAITRGSPLRYQAFSLLVLIQFLLMLMERSLILGFEVSGRNEPSKERNEPKLLRESLWFFASIMVSAFFVCYFAMAAVMNTNYFEMWACRLSSVLLLVRLAVEVSDRGDECGSVEPVCYTFLGLQGLCLALALFLSISMASDIKWKRYYFLGTLVSTQRIYRAYELFMAVRLVDLQCSIIMVLTGLIYFTSPNAGPAGLTAIGVTVVIGFLEVAWERASERAVRLEDAKAMYAFWALSPWLPCAMVALRLGAPALFTDIRRGSYLEGVILLSAALTLLARIATVVMTVILYREFGPNYVPLRRLLESEVSQLPLSRRNLAPSGAGVVVVENVAAGAAGGSPGGSPTPPPAFSEQGGSALAGVGAGAGAVGGSRVEEWATSKGGSRQE
jgi:hypothetical protein